jgi:hypothetical protein
VAKLLDFAFEWVLPGHGRALSCTQSEWRRDDPPPACDVAGATLGFAVANFVRTVGRLPSPELVP